MELEKCLNGRRSIRKYAKKPVEKDKIIKIIEAAQMAPSWKNSQASRFYVVSSSDMREKLLACLPEFNRESVENAPVLIVTSVVTKRSGFERDGSYSTHLKDGFQYFDNALAVQNLCLKAYEEGLGTLIMGLYDEKKIKELLGMPSEQELVAVIGVGYPDIEPDVPQRKPTEDVVTFL